MREIKFRVWDKEGGFFFEPTYKLYAGNLEELLLSMSGQLLMRTEDGIYHESTFPDRFVLMHYTGLDDDTGTPIYEGDIVEIQDTFETKTSYVSQVYFTPYWGAQVYYHPAHKKIGKRGRRDLYHYCSYGITEETSCRCKVIGNIYQHPELLSDVQ